MAQGVCFGHRFPIPVIGTVIAGSPNVLSDSRSQARIGDPVQFNCGHVGVIIDGDNTVLVNGRPAATIGSTVLSIVIAKIISSSPDITI